MFISLLHFSPSCSTGFRVSWVLIFCLSPAINWGPPETRNCTWQVSPSSCVYYVFVNYLFGGKFHYSLTFCFEIISHLEKSFKNSIKNFHILFFLIHKLLIFCHICLNIFFSLLSIPFIFLNHLRTNCTHQACTPENFSIYFLRTKALSYVIIVKL